MLKNFKIATKIIGTVVAVSFIGFGLSMYASKEMVRIDNGYTSLIDNQDVAAVKFVQGAKDVVEIAYASYQSVVYDGAGQQAKDAVAETVLRTDKAKKLFDEASASFPEAAADFEELKDELQHISVLSAKITGFGLQNDDASATEVLALLDKSTRDFEEAYNTIRERILEITQSASKELTDNTYSTIYTMIVVSMASLITGLAGGLLVSTKGITGPLNILRQKMGELASGRLDVDVVGQDRRDEVGAMAQAVQIFKDSAIENKRLEFEAATARQEQVTQRDRQSAIDDAKAEDLKVFVHAVEAGFDKLSSGDLRVRMTQAVSAEFEPIRAKFNASVEQLENTIGTVVNAVGTMRVGLNEITVAATDLSQRTEQQAASLEETVAALAEVVRGVNLTAQGAEDARAAATMAQLEAEKGGSVVSQAVAAMAEIEQSSEKISSIISVIDEIAFQTNLLALNAGVEAARAGEAGRGFAVVAQEVRGLAQRSAEAAKEIKGLISTSSTQVAHGVEFVSASGRSLEQIVSQVGSVTTMISEMARGAREQSIALKEVSIAADHMDKVTQQNAAMVEETTAAAQSLSAETEQLAAMVDGFQTARSQQATPMRPSARAASRPASSPSRPIAQMRSAGGAAMKPAAAKDEWAEF